MPIELVAALTAFIGAIISVSVSYFVSVRQTNIEFQKLRTEIHKAFGSKLFERRLEVYPELYAYVSNFIKVIQFGTISQAAVRELVSQWEEWDSKNAILFSATTGHISYKLRSMFAKMVKKSDEELQKEFDSVESREILREELGKLELALKHELGVYEFESPASFKERGLFTSYKQAVESTRETQDEQMKTYTT